MPKRFNYALKMEQLRLERGATCECGCGRTENLEFAHTRETGVFGRGRGRSERYHDIKKNPGAYRLLARRCHKKQELEMAARRIAMPIPKVEEREPGDDSGQEDW